MDRVSTSEARKGFAEIINRVAYGKEPVVIGRRGKELAAVIPMAALRFLQRALDEWEDRQDVEDALRVEADTRDESVPWEQVKRELGLGVPDRRKAKRPAEPRAATGVRPRRGRGRARRAR